jgi:hypothetical protein
VKLVAVTRTRKRYLMLDAAVVAVVAAVIGLFALERPGTDAPAEIPHGATMLTVAPAATGPVIPSGFLGLSLEYNAIPAYAGSDPTALDPVFLRLVRNLTPGQAPVLRIGGDSTDWTWWPVARISRPAGVTYTLNQRWLDVTRAMTRALGARLILGINLEADSIALANGEAQALLAGLGRASVSALELGNEPALYSAFMWYRTADGRNVFGRQRGYDLAAFTSDFKQFVPSLPAVPLAGPSVGGSAWLDHLGDFLAAVPKVSLATMHRYPMQLCFIKPNSPRYPSVDHLLANVSSAGLARSVAGYAAVAHARRLPIRLDEINTISCGADPAVSQTFASALWAADTLFELARAGFDGVNVHTFPGAGYEMFGIRRVEGRWRAAVAPEYYGLQLFARAAPPGARLVPVAGDLSGRLKVWATVGADGTVRVMLINKGSDARTVAMNGLTGSATLERLLAPDAAARSGVTLGGQRVGSDGQLEGRPQVERPRAAQGAFVVTLPPASAALLTITRR